MTRFLALVTFSLLFLGCQSPTQHPTTIYLPQGFVRPSPQVEFYPQGEAPEILFDHLDKIAGAYVDLVSLSRFRAFKGRLPEPAGRLSQPHGELRIVGPVYFDWPVVVYRKELGVQAVREMFLEGNPPLLGQSSGPTLYLPTDSELILARLVEQYQAWSKQSPSWPEAHLLALSHKPLFEGVKEADVSLLMRSQWLSLKEDKSANVIPFDSYQILEPEGPLIVAPWALVSAFPSRVPKRLFRGGPPAATPPPGSQLSKVTRSKARLWAHKLFPTRYNRQSTIEKVSLD